MEHDPRLRGDPCQVLERLDCPCLVVGVHDRHEPGVPADGSAQRVRIVASRAVDRQDGLAVPSDAAQPCATKRASVILPSSSRALRRIWSPHTGSGTKADASGEVSSPTFRGCVKFSMITSLKRATSQSDGTEVTPDTACGGSFEPWPLVALQESSWRSMFTAQHPTSAPWSRREKLTI